MPTFNVIIQPEAESDLDEAFQYLEEQRTGLGFELLEEITELLILLEEKPLMCQKIHAELRRAVIRRFRYNIIYKVVDPAVYIIAILHGSRSSKNWLDR